MTWLLILLALYLVYCGALYFNQSMLIFPSGLAGTPSEKPPYEHTEVIQLDTPQGTTTAWLIQPPLPADTPPPPLVVFFHGNAELIDHQHDTVKLYRSLGCSVLLIEYRGYGHSDGTPSEKHIVADSLAIMERVLKRDTVDPDRLVLHGRSIGGGLATQVALMSRPAALIVESTGTSVAGMAWRYGVPGFLVRSPLHTRQAFEELKLPILIMHGKDDEIFPVSHAHALDRAAPDSTLVLFNASHNTLPSGNEVTVYQESVKDHLERAGILPVGSGRTKIMPARSSP